MYYDRIDIREGIDPTKSNDSKECKTYYSWFFNHEFIFQDYVCNGCHYLTMLYLYISDIASITDYCRIVHDISKSEATCLLEYSVLDDCGYI